MAGRAFFVLQTGSIFSQKAGEHHGEPVVSTPRAETTEREKEREIRGKRQEGMVDFSSSHREFQARTEHSVSNPINPLEITNTFF